MEHMLMFVHTANAGKATPRETFEPEKEATKTSVGDAAQCSTVALRRPAKEPLPTPVCSARAAR